jgi:two-component sensor histidine kinase
MDGPKGRPAAFLHRADLCLALHELATNAAKYGAWRREAAVVAAPVDYEPISPSDRATRRVDESGVTMPEPNAPPQGGEVWARADRAGLPYQLGAETSYELGADGVRCTITLPLSSTTERADA